MKQNITKLLTIMFFACITATTFAYKPLLRYTKSLTIYNKTKKTFYFGTCIKPIYQRTMSLCCLPQKINPGINTIYIPHFKIQYPVFTTIHENVYTCGTQDNPRVQLPIHGDEIIVHSFILDHNGNPIALHCSSGG